MNLNPTNTYFYNHLQLRRHQAKVERLTQRLAREELKVQKFASRLLANEEFRIRFSAEFVQEEVHEQHEPLPNGTTIKRDPKSGRFVRVPVQAEPAIVTE